MDMQAIITQLLPIVQQVIGGVIKSGDSGVMGKMKEFGALTEFLKNAPTQFGGSDFMNQFFESLGGMNLSDMGGIDLDNLDVGSVLENVGNLDGILSEASDEDTQGVKGMIFALAETVAGAAGGGLMGSGEKLSAGESEYLDKLKSQLGL